MAYILSTLALLCFAKCIAENPENEQGFKDLHLQQHSSSWLNKLQDKQESTKTQNFVDLLYKFFKSENGVIPKGPRDAERQERNQRGLGTGFTTRRAGCRIFFWKTWTAC